jgi:integrase
LWKRPARRRGTKIVAAAVWIIKDGDRHLATGCVAKQGNPNPPAEAEKALADYIASKYRPPRTKKHIDEIDVADVLSIYFEATQERQASPAKFAKRIIRLNNFFGGRMLGEINSQLCNDYARSRRNRGGARRDLEDLRAAIRHHAKENLHDGMVHVTLPEKGLPRERWLTRSEAARLIWTCLRTREVQLIHRGRLRGQRTATQKRPLIHLARFILLGLYTGTRAGAIASASTVRDHGRSFVDLDAGIFYRLAQGKKPTNKRQPPVPIAPRLLAHLRRWQRLGLSSTHVIEYNGKPIKSVKTAFKTAVRKAGIDLKQGNITPHTLRHTAATWLMQQGIDHWKAAGFLGMSVKTLIEVYGHHHPDYMRDAAEAIGSRVRNRNVSVVESVVEINRLAENKKK